MSSSAAEETVSNQPASSDEASPSPVVEDEPEKQTQTSESHSSQQPSLATGSTASSTKNVQPTSPPEKKIEEEEEEESSEKPLVASTPGDETGRSDDTDTSPLHPLGHIKGQRTKSGTVTVTATGSFDLGISSAKRPSNLPRRRSSTTDDAEAVAAAERQRSNTAPADFTIPPDEKEQQEGHEPTATPASSPSSLSQEARLPKVEEDQSKDQQQQKKESDESTSVKSSEQQQQQVTTKLEKKPSEDDDDVKLAKAMALAFEQNPNMTPAEMAEIQESVRKKQQQQSAAAAAATPAAAAQSAAAAPATPAAAQPAAASSSLLIPGRLSTMFQQATAMAEEASAMMSGSTSAVASSTATSTSQQPVSVVPVAAASADAASSSTSPRQATAGSNKKPVRSSFRSMGENFKKRVAKTNITDLLPGKQQIDDLSERSAASGTTGDVSEPPPSSSSIASSVETNAKKMVLPFRNKLVTGNNKQTDDVIESGAASSGGGNFQQDMAEAPLSTGSNKRILHPFGSASKNIRPPPISPDASGEIPREVVDFATAAEGLLAVQPTASVDSTMEDSERGFTLPKLFNKTPSSSAPVRLTGTAWKRRSGFGKFSSTSAWERRRIDLQGTKLLYYQTIEESSEGAADAISPMSSKEEGGDAVATASSGEMNDSDHEGVVVLNNKKANWFEQAAATLTSSTAESPGGPRGYIDLAKDKATVQAAHGRSGEPSPFAISIKVRGETKWKFCFDYHKSQMEWLAALTDVVVQTSVDHYNKALLEAAHPTSQADESMFFPPPAVKEPPAPGEKGASQHRLWMMESYLVRGAGEGIERTEEDKAIGEEDGDKDDLTERTLESAVAPVTVAGQVETALDAATIEADTEENEKIWSIPEKNLGYLVGVLNMALIYARASSTTMEGFWYVVVFANLGVFLCSVKEPDWRRVVHRVQQFRVMSLKSSLVPSLKAKSELLKSVAPELILPKKKKPKLLPVAGTTTVKLKEPTDPPVNADGEYFGGWRTMPGETLAVRSHGYLSSKTKIESPGSLYECVHVDIFESPSRYPDMATRVQLPKAAFDDGGTPKTWHSPDIFIISIALPTDPPKITGGSTSDGGGYTVTMYYRMTQETRDILRRVTDGDYDSSEEKVDDPQKSKVNAVRLLEEWIRRAPTDAKFFSRFKVVPNAHNLKEIGMPSWISKYNGKPFLIKRPGHTGFIFNHPELSCLEFDISLHPFPYLAKKAICFMKESYFKRVLVTFGFVIEGRSDDELPECLIGLMQLCYPDPKYAIQADTFFHGTCNRSF